MQNSRSWLCLVSIVALTVVAVGVASAQGGTPNVPSNVALQGPTQAYADGRFFRGSGNDTYTVGFRGQMGTKSESSVWYMNMDSDSRNPINGAVRRSKLSLLGVGLKYEIGSDLAFLPAVDFPVNGPTGINTATGAMAAENRVIPSVALNWRLNLLGLGWNVQPKLVWFQHSIAASNGSTVQGFGRIFAVQVGVRKPLGDRLAVVGDVAGIFSGDNTVDENTNLVDKHVAWSGGISWMVSSAKPTYLTVYGTNAIGPTPSTSVIVAPGNSSCVGVRLDREL